MPRKKPNRTLLVVLASVAVVLALCALAGVVGAVIGKDKPAATSTAAATPASTDAYLAALAGIDPALAKGSAVNDGRNICLDIQQGKDEATVAKNAASRFSVDTAKAAKIVAAARQYLCPA